jgi:hypothetical protein
MAILVWEQILPEKIDKSQKNGQEETHATGLNISSKKHYKKLYKFDSSGILICSRIIKGGILPHE